MPLVVVTGLSGVGKSTVYERLRELGRDAWGSDEDGFLEWKDSLTGLPVPPPEDWRHVPAGVVCAGVSRERVAALRERAGDRTVYLCGCAGHEAAFPELIDHLICIVPDDATLRARLTARTNNDYGKSPDQLSSILEANRTWESAYRRKGATIIDATQAIDKVVADVVSAVEGSGPR